MIHLDPIRRAELESREAVHLVCPSCEWIALPPDGLLIDRLLRLIEHLDDVHPWILDLWQVAHRHRLGVAA